MYKIDKGTKMSLDEIAKKFHRKINPTKKSGVLYKNSLNKRVRRKYNSEKDPLKKYFYKLLVEKKYALINAITISKPAELKKIVQDFENLVNTGAIPAFYTMFGAEVKSTVFGEEVLDLFNYKGCRGSIKFHWWATVLGNRVCPYCNYEFTFFVKHITDEKILHDVDHFLLKAKVPYLSLAFYNLLPSCHNCNTNYKGAKIFGIDNNIHPYIDDFDLIQKMTIDSIIVDEDPASFNICFSPVSLNPTDIAKSNTHIKDFGLIGRYNEFKNDVIHLDGAKQAYPEKRKRDLVDGGGGLPEYKDREELIKFIRKVYLIPVNKLAARHQERGKLRLDIATEFELLK